MNHDTTVKRIPEQTLLVFSRNPLDGKYFEHILAGHAFVRYCGQVFTRMQFDAYAAAKPVSILCIETELYGTFYNLDHLREIHEQYPAIFILSFSLDDRSNMLRQNAMMYGAFAALVKPLSPPTLYRFLDRIGEQVSITDQTAQSVQFTIVPEKLNYYADTIKNAAAEELEKLINEVQQDVVEQCKGDTDRSRNYIRRHLHYLHNIFVNGQSHDAIDTIYSKHMEQLKSCSLEEMFAVLSDFIRDCNYVFNYSQQGLNRERINYAKTLIRQYLENGRTVTLNGIAEDMFISPFHLSRTFKKIEGINFMDYLQDARLEFAKILLATTDSPIETIAYRCGYNEVNSFRRMFRKKMGISPAAYRSQLKES